jgi:amidase
VRALFDQVELLALPTLPIFPPHLDEVTTDSLLPIVIDITRHVSPFNAAGLPCTAQPVATDGSAVPASLQLVGPDRSEELLLATARVVEAATRQSPLTARPRPTAVTSGGEPSPRSATANSPPE